MCNLTNEIKEQRIYKGRLVNDYFIYSKTTGDKIGRGLTFKSGSIEIMMTKSLSINPGDIIHFTCKEDTDKLEISEIVRIERKPITMKQVSFKDRQINRLMEAKS